jgi:hypothetical protein
VSHREELLWFEDKPSGGDEAAIGLGGKLQGFSEKLEGSVGKLAGSIGELAGLMKKSHSFFRKLQGFSGKQRPSVRGPRSQVVKADHFGIQRSGFAVNPRSGCPKKHSWAVPVSAPGQTLAGLLPALPLWAGY